MRFGVLGPLGVWTADGAPVVVRGAKVRALLAVLLGHEGRPVPVDRLIDDLWGDAPPRNPSGALQVKVSQLRRALDEAEPGARNLVSFEETVGYRLGIDAEAVDAMRFTGLLARAREAPSPRSRAGLLTEALELWRGPAYADFADEEFARLPMALLEEQRLTALEERAEARLEIGELGALAGELGDLVERHPLRERLRAAYMRALYGTGRQSDALETYADLLTRLREELGLDPGPEIAGLHRRILEQDPALATAPEAAPRTNLPAQISELVGREEAMAQVQALLKSARLVTLTGPGGVGKTRMALETAAGVAADHPDGVWLVELAGLDRTAGAPGTDRLVEKVIAVLDIRDDTAPGMPRSGAPSDPAERLADALRTRRTLLVLDNCEHVIDEVAALSERLLRAAPEVRILATSQEPLGLAGESVWPVPPLEAPLSPAETGVATLRRFSAVRLFEARAAAAVPGFVIDHTNARVVAAICRRLDGVPLALELAATRLRALDVHDLAERLDDRFRLLSSGHRGAPARQRTLRAMIDWSWELLSEPERLVLRRLAVHTEGCALEAAEVICADGGDVAPEDVLDLLARLVDRSMVVRAGGAGSSRYRLLESVAAYALDRLEEAGETERIRLRHLIFHTELAERAEPRLHGPDQRRWLRRLDAEHGNLRAALEEAVRRQDAGLALRLVNALAWYWFLRGRIGEGRRAFTMALAIRGAAPAATRARAEAWQTGLDLLGERTTDFRTPAETIADPGERARAEWFLSDVLLGAGDLALSQDLVNRALPVLQRLGDRWGTAAALATVANHALVRSDLGTLERAGNESLAIFEELGDRWGQVRAIDLLGRLAEIKGDHRRSADLGRTGLRLAEELGLWLQVSLLQSGLGRIALLAGDHAESDRRHERARTLAAEHGYRTGETFARTGLALTARRAGRLDDAEAHMRDVLAWEREVRYAPGIALGLAELGFAAEQRGDAAVAEELHREALAVAQDTGDPRAIALALEGLAGTAALTGAHAEAARLLGEAAALRRSAGAPLPPEEHGDVDRITATARSALGDDAFATAFAEGHATA
ncbi:BTAD domain-containing putative transcriptional regulator [Nonomuraea ferruginea]|uniref:BTAD domain-containing putative transcriptional regulator n=1 Tax=Nonomuraea ferruginea TaxID=46174 RepID=A0ABT4SYI1_9ACTN|nr:BTAD domain-containing putative transcriptional regulator [Nonomuraea ferruginea]MDA0642306.1 BTAD domain-containing putative transcriptional regulator [Nonomuraea ferruginea]